MVESGPAVMTKAMSKPSATASASRLCARLGDKFERTNCCSSSTAAAVFAIGAAPYGLKRAQPILFGIAAPHTRPPGSQSRPFCQLEGLATTHDVRDLTRRPAGARWRCRSLRPGAESITQ